MADRKAELERKKAKLEELRKEKQRRQQERERQEVLLNTFLHLIFIDTV
jgi:dynein intermediate chain